MRSIRNYALASALLLVPGSTLVSTFGESPAVAAGEHSLHAGASRVSDSGDLVLRRCKGIKGQRCPKNQ